MTDTENLQTLPVEWCWTTIDSICKITSGFAFKSKDFCEEGIPAIKISNVSYGEFLWKQQEFLPVEFIEEYQDFLVCPKDILLALTRPITNNAVKVCKYPIGAPKGLLNQRVAIIKPDKGCVERFLLYYFQSNSFKLQIENNISETLQPNLSPKKLSDFLLPLPPLPEQRAIVSKIELLFSELDNGIANLKLAQEQLKVYRQAVLKKAFEGELTKKWREQQTDLPDAEDLLEQIRRDREEAAKVSTKKIKAVKPLTEDELAELPRIPEKWRWVKTADIIDPINNGYTPKANFLSSGSGEVPFIKVYNLNFDGSFNFQKDPTFIPKIIHKKELARSVTYPGDVLINIVGPPLGKLSIVSSQFPEWNINQAIVLFRPNKWVTTKNISYYLQNPKTIQWLENTSKATAGQFNVKVSTCREIPFPLFSIEEQQAIVQEIETRLSVCDKIEQDIKENLEKAEALRQSILKKAFEGKLLNARELAEVRRAEDWEPAEVLLERIRAERVRK